MSTVYAFQESESLLTSTTTSAVLASTDALLVNNVSANKAFQTTPGAIANQTIITQATTSSTGTNISPYGTTQIFWAAATSATTLAWQLADPPSIGLCKTLFLSSTTSSGTYINAATATIVSSGSATGRSVNFGIAATAMAGGVFCQLESLSTSVWIVVGRSAAGCATT